MKIFKIFLVLFFALLLSAPKCFSIYAYLESGIVKEGGLVKIKIGNKKKISAADVLFMGKKYPAFLSGYDRREYEYVYLAMLPVPVGASGRENIVIRYMLGDKSEHIRRERVLIKKLKREITRLDTGGQMSKRMLRILGRENKVIYGAQKELSAIMYELPFIRPIGEKGSRESTAFGTTRIYDNGAAKWMHKGIDIAAPAGTKIKASNSGTVAVSMGGEGHGNTVVINHGGGIFSFYYHMKKRYVKKGQKVKKGDIIGTVGSTGLSTGPHLHWQINVFEVPVNPVELLTGF